MLLRLRTLFQNFLGHPVVSYAWWRSRKLWLRQKLALFSSPSLFVKGKMNMDGNGGEKIVNDVMNLVNKQ